MQREESKQGGAAPTCVVLAIAHGGLSEGVRGLLSTLFESVVLVADERSLKRCLAALHPPLLVLDLSFVTEKGMDLATRLKAEFPGVRILLLVDDRGAEVATAGARSGAEGCLLKQELGRDLLPAVEEVLAGGRAFWSGNHREPERAPEPRLRSADAGDGRK